MCMVSGIACFSPTMSNGWIQPLFAFFVFRDVQKKAGTMLQNIGKQGKLDVKLEKSFRSAKTVDELTHLVRLYLLVVACAKNNGVIFVTIV